MAEVPSLDEKRYALVSSLYGSGTIACWYLTAVSVLLSWTLHPYKRKSGSIDVDLIVTLTLPAVAAGHLLWQLRRFQAQSYGDFQAIDESALWRRIQDVAAIEAPFNVVETFMSMSVIFFIVAAWMFCVSRAITVGIIGLLCFTIECYVYFSNVMDLGLRHERGGTLKEIPAFSRYFVANFTSLVIGILVILGACALISIGLASFLLRPRSTPPPQSQESVNEANHDRVSTNNAREVKAMRYITVVTILFLPLSFVATLAPTALHATAYLTPDASITSSWQSMKRSLSRFVGGFFPRTACSLTDLDQAVALGSGATILAFQIYSVAAAHVAIWKNRRVARSGQHRDDPIQLHHRD